MTDDKLYTSLSANNIMDKLKKKNTFDANTIHWTLKITSAQVVETSVTNNISFQNYLQLKDDTIRINYPRLGRRPCNRDNLWVLRFRIG